MEQTQLQVLVGVISAFVIQWLKKSSWFPVLTERADWIVKVVFAALVAAGSAISISFTYDATLDQLLVSGLSWANVIAGLQAFLVSFLSQQLGYRTMVKPVEPEDV